MRITFNTFASVWPVVCEPQTKAGVRAAHVLRNTRRIQRGQAGRQKGVGPGKRVNELTLGGKEERIACRRLSARYVNTRSPAPTPSLADAYQPVKKLVERATRRPE